MSKQLRVGFTLVELLVVITIIALLVALLVPAVGSARAQARRTQCTHNQGELGKALQTYVAEKKFYPGYVNRSLASSNQRPLTWLEMLLPYVDQGALWGSPLGGQSAAWRVATSQMSFGGAGVPSIVVPVYVCPADSNLNNIAAPASKTSYAANCGVADDQTAAYPLDRLSTTSGYYTTTGDTNVNPKYNGVFTFQFYQVSQTQQPPQTPWPVRIRPEDVKNGQAQTMLISENLQAGSWYDPYAFNSNAPAPYPASVVLNTVASWAEPMVGLVWWPDGTSPTPLGINDDANPPQVPDSTYYLHARPSSGHPGGVVVTYCDGHTDFLRSDTDYSVLRQMMTPDSNGATNAAKSAGCDPNNITY